MTSRMLALGPRLPEGVGRVSVSVDPEHDDPGTLAAYARSYGINKIGLRRKGFSPQVINAIDHAYKLLVRRRAPRDEALQQLDPLAQQFDEVRLFVDFVTSSARGIVR